MARSSKRRVGPLVVAAAVVAVMVTAVALVWARSGAEPPASAAPVALVEAPTPAPVADPAGPTRTDRGMPVGWRHDETGATAAALGYVTASASVAKAGPLSRRDMVLAIATRAYGETLAGEVNTQLEDLFSSTGQQRIDASSLVWAEFPLSSRTTTASGDRANVDVWSVLVFAPSSTASVVRQLWRTSTLSLVWEAGDWKVDQWTSVAGPTPAPPTEMNVTRAADVVDEAGWAPAARGGR
jgi:hypothetical protein